MLKKRLDKPNPIRAGGLSIQVKGNVKDALQKRDVVVSPHRRRTPRSPRGEGSRPHVGASSDRPVGAARASMFGVPVKSAPGLYLSEKESSFAEAPRPTPWLWRPRKHSPALTRIAFAGLLPAASFVRP
jgi:hypothetical protein